MQYFPRKYMRRRQLNPNTKSSDFGWWHYEWLFYSLLFFCSLIFKNEHIRIYNQKHFKFYQNNQILDVWVCGKQPGNFLYHRTSGWEKPLVLSSKDSIAKYYTKKIRAAWDGNSNYKLTGSKSDKQFSILLIVFQISSSY